MAQPDNRIEQDDPNFYKPHQGYKRYFRPARSGGLCWMAYPRRPGAWRLLAHDTLLRIRASCLWHSLLWVCNEEEFAALYEQQTVFHDKFERRWTPAEVAGLLVGAGVQKNVYVAAVVPPLGGVAVEHFMDDPLRAGLGLIFLPVDDNNVLDPHWAGVTAVYMHSVHPLPQEVLDAAEGIPQPAPIGPDGPPLVPVLPPVAGAALRRRVLGEGMIMAAPHPMLEVRRAIGLIPPPFTDREQCAFGVEQRFHNVSGTRVDAGHALVIPGFPSGVDDAWDNVWGLVRAYQLCPEVMESGKVEVRKDTKFYLHLGTYDAAVDGVIPCVAAGRTRLVTGDYNPEFLGQVITEDGTWSLVDPVVVRGRKNQVFEIYSVHRVNRTVWGACKELLPFTSCTALYVTNYNFECNALPTLDQFGGSREMYLHAVMTQLGAQAGDEDKGYILDQRNKVLSLLRGGELDADFDAVRFVQALLDAKKYAQRYHNVAAGAIK